MVNELQDLRAREQALALSYAPAQIQAALAALWALDARLRAITLAARDPTIGLMRLTWWREALTRLDTAPPPAEPVLTAVATAVLPRGISGATLASMSDAWEQLLEPSPDLAAFADGRGGKLFATAAAVLNAKDVRSERVGAAWALTDVMRGWPELGLAAGILAAERLEGVFAEHWPRSLRPLGALGLLARSDLDAKSRPGSLRRVARLLAHRLTGR